MWTCSVTDIGRSHRTDCITVLAYSMLAKRVEIGFISNSSLCSYVTFLVSVIPLLPHLQNRIEW